MMLHIPELIVLMWMLLVLTWVLVPTFLATAWFTIKIPSLCKNRFRDEENGHPISG